MQSEGAPKKSNKMIVLPVFKDCESQQQTLWQDIAKTSGVGPVS